MSNEDLVIHIQAGMDTDGSLMAELWTRNTRFIYKIACRYTGMAEVDDLMQEGFLGLNNAVDHWQQDAGAKFMTYAGFWVQQSMIRYIDHNSTLSISMHQNVHRLQRVLSQFEQEYGRPPTKKEVCCLLDISESKLDTIQKAEQKADYVSLDSPVDTESSIVDLMPSNEDVEAYVLDRVEQEELSNLLWGLVDSLPGEMPEILRERYQRGKTLKQISMETGRTQNQIAGVEHKGIQELRRAHRRKQLEPYTDDLIRTKALQGNGVARFNRSWTSSTEREALNLSEK